MDCGLLCEECQVLYARFCAQDDPAAWEELKTRATRVFLQALDKQVGTLIPCLEKQRLAEHAIEVTRRRARLNLTWASALRDARGVLARLVARVLVRARAHDPDAEAPRTASAGPWSDGTQSTWKIVGDSGPMRMVREQVAIAARSNLNVLIIGETGTGKELVARAIHSQSEHGGRPFIKHNCAASLEHLFESQFFGHRQGSFTGAARDHIGLLELADGSILFLDEIETLAPTLQAKLLCFFDDGEIWPVGSRRQKRVSVRVLAATNRDPEQLLAEGMLREDFLYRLRDFEIRLPALREHSEDIPLLVEHFMRRDNGSTTLSTGTMDLLMSHGWPGNVRELRGVLCAAKAIAKAEHQRIISPVHVRIRYPGLGANGSATSLSPAVFHPPGMKLRDTLKDCERRALIQALCRAQGDLAGAARLLDVSRTTLWRLIKRHRVERSPATLSSNGETNGTRRFRSETRRFRKETSPLSS